MTDSIGQKRDSARFTQKPQELFGSRLAQIEIRIARACREAGRDRSEVRMLPITKTIPAEILRHAFAASLRDFAARRRCRIFSMRCTAARGCAHAAS